MTRAMKWTVVFGLLFGSFVVMLFAQMQQSGGPGSAVTVTSGSVTVSQGTASNLKVDLSGTAANSTALKVDGSAVTQPVSGTFWQATQPVSGTVTVNALPAGTNNIGFVRALPSGCTQSTNFANSTAQVATGAGTTVTSTTTCVTFAYANNITKRHRRANPRSLHGQRFHLGRGKRTRSRSGWHRDRTDIL